MAKKKEDGLLGPDGRAVSEAFGGIGNQMQRYLKWRKEREARIQAQQRAAQTKPTKTKPAKTKPTPTKKKPSNTIPPSKRPADMRQGQVYGNDSKSHGRNWSNPHGQVSNKPSEGDRSTWSKPKPKPETETTTRNPSSRNPSSRQPVARKPSPTRTRTPQSKDMDANYKAWAKANPGLAKKVKKGQAGYKAINSSSSKAASSANAQNLRSGPTPPKKTSSGTGNHRGAGNGAPGAQRSTLKTTATKPTPKTTAKPAEKKPAKQKPLAVPPNQIPKNLNSPAGRKYIADLDAGKLTRRKK